MIQLEILSGKTAGARHEARRFPFRLGRASAGGLRLEEAGVWDAHAEIHLEPGEGYQVAACGEALLRVNGQAISVARLRAGDVIELGTVKLRFWLGNTESHGLRAREVASWMMIVLMVCTQIVLIYLLL